MPAKKSLSKLQCSVCKITNYFTNKSKKVTTKLEMEKFCNTCKKHTLHKEVKK